MRFERRLLALVSLAVFASIVFASVFVYYPATITVSPVKPPVVFIAGSNANGTDLLGNTITVNIGQNSTSLSVTIHPTYQLTYYKNVTIIKNVDSRVYYVYLRVQTPVQIGDTGLPQGSQLILYIYQHSMGASRSLSGNFPPTPTSGSYAASLSLTTTGQTDPITLSSGDWLELDVYVSIPEGNPLPSPVTAQLLLVYTPYTPSTETPP